jgi:hypothetical protein
VAAEECGCAGAQNKRSADPLGQTLESQDGPKHARAALLIGTSGGGYGEVGRAIGRRATG